MLHRGDKSHRISATVRLPVEIVFEFLVDGDRDTIRGMEEEARLVAQSKIDEILKKVSDERVRQVSVGCGRLKKLGVIEKFGAGEEFETMDPE